jgi:cation diffusion facilitator CzcD-associated flavoprotein CzcO
MTVGVIGAGTAGLAAARGLQRASIPFEVIERERDVGGIWHVSLSQPGLPLRPPAR